MKICKTFNIYKIYKIWSPVLPPNSSFAGAGILLRPRPFKTFFESAEQLPFGTTHDYFFYVSITYLHKRKTASQQTIACSRSTIQKLEYLGDVYKI